MKFKSSDEFLKVLMIEYYDSHKIMNNLDHAIRGMYQLEEKQK